MARLSWLFPCVQIFDAIIVMASFVLDVVFLDGVTDVSEGEQAAAIIMCFLLWRVLRIVNGKQRRCKQDQWRIQDLQTGTRTRRRRRRWSWGVRTVSPPHWGRGLGGAMPPPQNFFWILDLKMRGSEVWGSGFPSHWGGSGEGAMLGLRLGMLPRQTP